ncbi:hypothetical protein GCM10009839_39290 [Catenulispora yoronensis]|uniref:DUF4232 domain-containing protein n=1 Tax=Catenulispora yoronensis TaxID=450799 RepID=A0ABN2UCV0_9ACTN
MLAVLAALALILYACSDSGSGKKKPAADGRSSSPAASQSSLASSGGSTSAAASGGATASSGGASSSASGASGGAPSGSVGGPTGSSGGTGGTGGSTASGAKGSTAAPNTGATGCQLSLTLSSQAQYANGDQPAFTITAFNKGTADCDVDFSPRAMVLNIFSGADRIWSSADCGLGARDIRGIAPETAQNVTYTWNRVRSATGCPGGQPSAKLGTYFGVVSLAAGNGTAAPAAQSQPKTFELKSGS